MKRAIAYFLLSFALLTAIAQRSEAFEFRHISEKEGLPYSWVTGIYKDSDNDMWFSSNSGVYRYDGSAFFTCTFENSSSGGVSPVRSVLELSSGKFAIATNDGILIYDKNTGVVKKNLLQTVSVNDLVCDRQGVLWAATIRGAYHIDDETALPVFFPAASASDENGQKADVPPLRCAMVDSGDNIWLGTTDGHIYCVDRKREAVKEIAPSIPLSGNITDLFEDSANNIWIASSAMGVVRYNTRNGNCTPFNTSNGKLPHNLARQVEEDKQGNVWIATEKGISVVSQEGNIRFVQTDARNRNSLNDDAVYSLHCDETGNMWVGTFFGGINLYCPGESLFDVSMNAREDNSSERTVVSSFEKFHGKMLVGTENKGIIRMESEEKSSGQSFPLPEFLNNANVHSLCFDSRDNLWIGTYYTGLYLKKNGSAAFKRINYKEQPGGMGDNVYRVFEDSRSNLWVGTQTNGLLRYDFDRDELVHFPSALPHNLFVWDIVESRDGCIWLACFNKGIWKLDPGNGYEPVKVTSQAYTCITLCELQDGNLLVGTEKEGMFIVSPDGVTTRKVECIGGQRCPNTVYGILQDRSGDIWFSTNSGLYRSDRDMLEAKVYTVADGLPTNRFNYNAAAVIDDVLYFGSVNGLVSVHPQVEDNKPLLSAFKFNKLYINGIEQTVGTAALPRNLSCLKKLTLAPDQNVFSISFSDYDYESVRRMFIYRMKGVSQGWNAVTGGKRIDFTGLPAGSYILEVAQGNHGAPVGEVYTLQIVIKPYWWQSTLTRVLAVVFLLSILAIILVTYFISEKRKQELEFEKVQREKDKEVNEMKDRFFTNVTHEFKNPIALILGPLEQLTSAANLTQAKRIQYQTVIKENADRLLHLVDEVLAFRETGMMEAEIREGLSADSQDRLDSYALEQKDMSKRDLELNDSNYTTIAAETTILIVDQDQSMRDLLKDFFEAAGYKTAALSNCLDVAGWMDGHKVDVVISDILFQEKMEGYQLCKDIKDKYSSRVFVILNSVLSDSSHRLAAYKSGADSFVPRPFALEMLGQRVRNLLVGAYLRGKDSMLNIDMANLNVDSENGDEAFIRKISAYVFENISDTTLNTESICDIANMSKATLYRRLKSTVGMSANEFINEIRLKYAEKLLDETSLPVSDIAFNAGFSDAFYFSRAFKKKFGLSPKNWRLKDISNSMK